MRPNETPEGATELLEEAAPGPPAPPGNWTSATEEEEVQPKPCEGSSRGSGSSRAGAMVSLSSDNDVPGRRPPWQRPQQQRQPHPEHRSRKDPLEAVRMSPTLSATAAKTPEAVRMSLTLSAAKTSNPAAVRKSLSLKGGLKGEGGAMQNPPGTVPLP